MPATEAAAATPTRTVILGSGVGVGSASLLKKKRLGVPPPPPAAAEEGRRIGVDAAPSPLPFCRWRLGLTTPLPVASVEEEATCTYPAGAPEGSAPAVGDTAVAQPYIGGVCRTGDDSEEPIDARR